MLHSLLVQHVPYSVAGPTHTGLPKYATFKSVWIEDLQLTVHKSEAFDK